MFSGSDSMNAALVRLGVTDIRAVPGTSTGPALTRAFDRIADRLDDIEARLHRLERVIHLESHASDHL